MQQFILNFVQYLFFLSIYSTNDYMNIAEQELVNRCRQGDNTAQKELYEIYAGKLLSVCMRYMPNRAIAEDLLHDAFIKIFGSLDKFSFRGVGSLRAWMERVTINIALEHLRREKRFRIVDIDDSNISDISDIPAEEAVADIPREVILKYVQQLPDGYRTVFNLFYIEGWSHKDIAKELSINEKSSSSQLARAKSLLATKLKEYIKQKT